MHSILFSGGKESFYSLIKLVENKHKPFLIFIDYGQPTASFEKDRLYYAADKYKLDYIVLNYPIEHNLISSEDTTVNIPYRNSILVLAAANYLTTNFPKNKHFIYLNLDDSNIRGNDGSSNFEHYINVLLSYYNNKVKVVCLTSKVTLRSIYEFLKERNMWNELQICLYQQNYCGKCLKCASVKEYFL